jgi:nitric oxide reductase NorQ protein
VLLNVAAVNARTLDPAHHLIEAEPYYEPGGDELKLFEAAYRQQIPVLLKGPTGCGKTRFMEHMAWRLKRPLIAVSWLDQRGRARSADSAVRGAGIAG